MQRISPDDNKGFKKDSITDRSKKQLASIDPTKGSSVNLGKNKKEEEKAKVKTESETKKIPWYNELTAADIPLLNALPNLRPEAREAILALDRQLAEKEEQQKREIANIKSREEAEILKVAEEERLKSETARINTTEKVAVAEENKDRLVIVALKNKERTEAVETERVEKDRALEQTERERVVTLAQIEKDKAVEVEKKNSQDVIRDRVVLEKGVVQEQENMKDIEAFKTADRQKKVAVTLAEKESEELYIKGN